MLLEKLSELKNTNKYEIMESYFKNKKKTFSFQKKVELNFLFYMLFFYILTTILFLYSPNSNEENIYTMDKTPRSPVARNLFHTWPINV